MMKSSSSDVIFCWINAGGLHVFQFASVGPNDNFVHPDFVNLLIFTQFEIYHMIQEPMKQTITDVDHLAVVCIIQSSSSVNTISSLNHP